MHEEIEMTYNTSMVLYNILHQILYETVKDDKGVPRLMERKVKKTVTNEDGTTVDTEEELPFRLKYRIGRNIAPLEKDVYKIQQQSMLLTAIYGRQTADKKGVEIANDKKREKYNEEMAKFLNTKVKHTIMRLEPEDIDLIGKPIDVTYEQMQIFIGYMMNEPELFEDIKIEPLFEENK